MLSSHINAPAPIKPCIFIPADWSRGYGLPEQRLGVMNYTDTTIAEDNPFVGAATCT